MALLVEMGWGGAVQDPDAITWTDISSRVNLSAQGVSISRGASDELSETQPGTATLRLDNQDGWLTPGNSGSPYYPFVRRNAPVRVSVAVMPPRTGAAPYPMAMLADAFDLAAPAAMWTVGGGANITDGRMRLPATGTSAFFRSVREWTLIGSQLTAKFATPIADGGSASASVSMYVHSATSGTRLRWYYNPIAGELRALNEVASTDGAPTVLTYSPIDHAWLRIREAAGTVFFETSGDGYDWTVRRSLVRPAWVTSDTHQVEFAAFRSGGTPDFAEFDLLGHVVYPRFYGQVNEFPIAWAGLVSTVTVSATDLFKRLNKLPALKSCLAEEIRTGDAAAPFYSVLSAYFPLTEPSDSLSAGDLSGRSAGAIAQTQVGAGGTLAFGTDGLPATGDTSLTLTPASTSAGKYLTGDLGAVFQSDSNVTDDHTSLLVHLEFWFKTTVASRAIVGLLEPGLDHQLVLALNASGVLTVETTETGDALGIVTTSSGALTDGAWHHVVYDSSAKQIWVDGTAVGGALAASSTFNQRTLHVGGYQGARLFSGQIAHVAVHHSTGPLASTFADHYTAGTTAFSGESADLRIERLARYAGIASVTVYGSTHDPIASQGEGGTGALARMREVETTEAGRLYAERDYYGLAYQSRDVRYNPDPAGEVFTIDHADLDTNDMQLADDDQKLVNSVEASRPGGATQRVTASASIAAFSEYPKPLTLLKTSDNSVLDAANWLVSRYADPPVELREVPIEAYTLPYYEDILDADISDYFTVYNLPPQTDPEARVTVEGYTETIGEQSHKITFRTSAAARDSVWVLEDPVYGVLDQTTRCAY